MYVCQYQVKEVVQPTPHTHTQKALGSYYHRNFFNRATLSIDMELMTVDDQKSPWCGVLLAKEGKTVQLEL